MITLSKVMKANALSCISFGIAFLIFPEEISHFMSEENRAPNVVFIILGIGLFLNGVHLLWASFIPMPSKLIVLYFSGGDYLWVAATSYLLLNGIWIATQAGTIVTLLVSAMVATFGVLQMIKRKAMGNC